MLYDTNKQLFNIFLIKISEMSTSKKIYFTLFFLFTVIASQAQNKSFDWGVGIHGSLYSYSAMVESKISSPYQYNRGLQLSVSRYLNNNFDAEFNAGRTTTKYYTGMFNGENTYESTKLYDGAVSLKYKLDNGYIIKHENYVVSPFVKAGIGTNYVGYMDKMDVTVPMGFGLTFGMGKYVSCVYESSFRYNLIAGNTYATHSIGLKASLGRASKTRITATRIRERERKLAGIEKKREQSAKAKLARALEKEERRVNREEKVVITSLSADEVEAELPEPIVDEAIEVETVETVETIAETEETFSSSRPATIEEKEPVIEKEIEVAPTVEKIVVEEKPIPTKPVVEEKPVKVNDDYCLSSAAVLTGFGKDVSFDVNSSNIRSRMHGALAEIVTTMKRCEGTNFTVIAHTDSDGDVAYNNRLAKKRATAVKKYLISKGVDASRLTTLAYGEYMAEGETTTDKASNRRISFKVNRTSF